MSIGSPSVVQICVAEPRRARLGKAQQVASSRARMSFGWQCKAWSSRSSQAKRGYALNGSVQQVAPRMAAQGKAMQGTVSQAGAVELRIDSAARRCLVVSGMAQLSRISNAPCHFAERRAAQFGGAVQSVAGRAKRGSALSGVASFGMVRQRSAGYAQASAVRHGQAWGGRKSIGELRHERLGTVQPGRMCQVLLAKHSPAERGRLSEAQRSSAKVRLGRHSRPSVAQLSSEPQRAGSHRPAQQVRQSSSMRSVVLFEQARQVLQCVARSSGAGHRKVLLSPAGSAGHGYACSSVARSSSVRHGIAQQVKPSQAWIVWCRMAWSSRAAAVKLGHARTSTVWRSAARQAKLSSVSSAEVSVASHGTVRFSKAGAANLSLVMQGRAKCGGQEQQGLTEHGMAYRSMAEPGAAEQAWRCAVERNLRSPE